VTEAKSESNHHSQLSIIHPKPKKNEILLSTVTFSFIFLCAKVQIQNN
jgi:hypothetical protein